MVGRNDNLEKVSMRISLNSFVMQPGKTFAVPSASVGGGWDDGTSAFAGTDESIISSASGPFSDNNHGLFRSGGSGGIGAQGMTDKLRDRVRKLAEQGVELSLGFLRLLSSGDMHPQFAEMLILGLVTRLARKEALSGDLIRDVIGKVRGSGIIVNGLFSPQFNAELSMAGIEVEDHFEIATKDGKTLLATKEEPLSPEPAPAKETVGGIQFEVEVLEPEIVGAGQMILAGRRGTGERVGTELAISPGAAAALEMVSSRRAAEAFGLPVGILDAVQALAAISPHMAMSSAQGLHDLMDTTDPQRIADAIVRITNLYPHSESSVKSYLLKTLANLFLKYDETQQAETVENARRIRREVISALRKIDIRSSFVKELETFTNGTTSNKAIAIQSLAASLHDGKWDGDKGITFAKYLVARLVLAEIKSGSSADVLSAAMDSVHVIAADIIAEGQTDEFVSNLIIRTGAKDVSEERSVVHSGLTALLRANKDIAIVAMESQLKDNLFQTTDVLIYRLLVQHYDTPEKRRVLARRMVSDHVNITRMDRSIRQTLREAIVQSGEVAIPFIVDEYNKAEASRQLSPERREDMVRMVFDIIASLTPVQIQALPAGIKTIFERAAGELYLPQYRTNENVIAGVSGLDDVRGQELLAFFKAKADVTGIGPQEREFWIKRMAVKTAALKGAIPEQAEKIVWAFTEALRIFEEYADKTRLEMISLFFSASAAPFQTVRSAFERISALPRSSRLPERDRAILIAMAGNHGISKGFLVGTVGKRLAEIAEGVFASESAADSLKFTTQELGEEVVSVRLNLDHGEDTIIGDELRGALAGFLKDRRGRYAFEPKTGKLTIKGEMTAADRTRLLGLLGVTRQEEIRIGKNELPGRVAGRKAAIDSLQAKAAEEARRSKATAETMGVDKSVFRMDDIDMASDLSDSPPLKIFEDAVEGLARLYGNTQLGQDERDKFLAKLIELHDRAVSEASQGSADLGSSDSWSYAVVRPLVELFVGRKLGKTAQAANAFLFIFSNLIGGRLSISSRRTLWGLFIKQFDQLGNVPQLIFLITGRLCDAIAKKPKAEWTPEREFLAAILGSFGENGNTKHGMFDTSYGLEERIKKWISDVQ